MAVADVVALKQESIDLVDLETRVVQLCKDNPKGIPDSFIKNDMPFVSAQQRVSAINRLLSTGQIELLKSGNSLVYRFKDSTAASKTKGFEAEEKLVYQIIEDAGNKGIWIRDIRYQCNLQMTQVNKILKNLESKKLVKAVNSVAAGKKKVYMLFNLKADASVTGGAWYNDQDFESEFVDILSQQSLKFLQERAKKADELKVGPLAKQNASFTSSHQVWKYIADLGISKVPLTVQDIETILQTLIFDGRAEMTVVAGSSDSKSDGTTTLFRAVQPLVVSPGLVQVPCGLCKVAKDCHDGGEISPQTCIYMNDWLSF